MDLLNELANVLNFTYVHMNVHGYAFVVNV